MGAMSLGGGVIVIVGRVRSCGAGASACCKSTAGDFKDSKRAAMFDVCRLDQVEA